MQDLHDSMKAAEGATGAEQEGRPGQHKNCLNCGTELKGLYCHHCGQKDLPQRQTTTELLANFISSFSNYEGKFLLTAKYLITRPGFLALDYNSGKRERYFHPVRMYAFISFIFFFLFFSLPEDKKADRKPDEVELSEEDRQELNRNPEEIKQGLARFGVDTSAVWVDSTMLSIRKKDSTQVQPKPKNRFNYGLSKSDYKSKREYDSAQTLLPEEQRDGWFVRRITERSIELNEKYGDKPGAFGNDFWKASIENFSTLLFFLLPVFALLLKLLYIRRSYFYSEHLVFSIYYYNFFYFAGSVMMLVGLVPAMNWLSTAIGFVIYFYLLFAMRRMYGQGWRKTIAKFLVFSAAFMLCFFFAFLINLFIIVMIL
jgi:hypothetical protein